jgi:DNA polymerase III delta prime subunit
MKRLIAKQTPSPDNIFQALNNLKSEFESKFDENKFLELAKTDATKANSYIDSIVSSVTIEETVDKALEDYEKKLVEYDTELYSVKDFLYRFHNHISFNLACLDYVYGDTENRLYNVLGKLMEELGANENSTDEDIKAYNALEKTKQMFEDTTTSQKAKKEIGYAINEVLNEIEEDKHYFD